MLINGYIKMSDENISWSESLFWCILLCISDISNSQTQRQPAPDKKCKYSLWQSSFVFYSMKYILIINFNATILNIIIIIVAMVYLIQFTPRWINRSSRLALINFLLLIRLENHHTRYVFFKSFSSITSSLPSSP